MPLAYQWKTSIQLRNTIQKRTIISLSLEMVICTRYRSFIPMANSWAKRIWRGERHFVIRLSFRRPEKQWNGMIRSIWQWFILTVNVCRQFQRIQDLAKTPNNSPIGILTAENRDTWAEARQIILDASPDNKKALERVESAIIVLALDDSKPVTREQISRGIWIGDGRSKWFDKHQCESICRGSCLSHHVEECMLMRTW